MLAGAWRNLQPEFAALGSLFCVQLDDGICREAHGAGDVFRLFTGYPQLLVTKQRIRAEKTGFGGRRDLRLFDTIVFYTAHKHRI